MSKVRGDYENEKVRQTPPAPNCAFLPQAITGQAEHERIEVSKYTVEPQTKISARHCVCQKPTETWQDPSPNRTRFPHTVEVEDLELLQIAGAPSATGPANILRPAKLDPKTQKGTAWAKQDQKTQNSNDSGPAPESNEKGTACTKNWVEDLLRPAPESNEVPAHHGSRGPRSATNSGRTQRYGSCKILPVNLDPKTQTGTAWARWQNKQNITITLNHNPIANQTGFPH
ncbi:hypothetical protein DFH08DRAFT_826707 [Mycena albidolilacea]|uniref:Uncharacterized protein n=1 Tax=Mycena albidolilacea TaxID=1033008 RepID=A0AAD6YZS6_9AGAR|nr:hypothetical protein DFH08DRAFT_826707 [Mycena albidolilacea]